MDRIRDRIDREATKALREAARKTGWELKKAGWKDDEEWNGLLESYRLTCEVGIITQEQDTNEYDYGFWADVDGEKDARNKASAIQRALQDELKVGDTWEDHDKFLRFIQYELEDAVVKASKASEFD